MHIPENKIESDRKIEVFGVTAPTSRRSLGSDRSKRNRFGYR